MTSSGPYAVARLRQRSGLRREVTSPSSVSCRAFIQGHNNMVPLVMKAGEQLHTRHGFWAHNDIIGQPYGSKVLFLNKRACCYVTIGPAIFYIFITGTFSWRGWKAKCMSFHHRSCRKPVTSHTSYIRRRNCGRYASLIGHRSSTRPT